MRLPQLSLQQAYGLTVSFLGLVALALLYTSTVLYQQLGQQQRVEALESLLAIKTADTLERANTLATELGFSLQAEPDLRDALRQENRATLTHRLQEAYRRYFVTMGLVRLEALTVLDLELNLLAGATNPASAFGEADPCQSLNAAARKRTGADRLKPIHSLCQTDNQPLLAVLVAVGGLRPAGYIKVAIDPTWNLQQLAPSLGMPVRILDLDGLPRYVSEDWPASANLDHYVVATHQVEGLNGPILRVEAGENLANFNHVLERMRNWILLGTGTVLATTLLAALVVLRRSHRHLALLRRGAEAVADGQYEPIEGAFSPELQSLAHAFNRMVLQVRLHRENLEELVASRTQALEAANAKLAQDIDRQREVERMKDEFIAMINHEMRTPVTAIRGALGLVQAGVVGSVQSQSKELVNLAQRNCDRLLRLINDVLDLQRLAEGHIAFNSKEQPLAPIVHASLATTEPFATRFGVGFRAVEVDADITACVDADRLAQVLANLLSNAAKYTQRGDIVEVSLVRDENQARIQVRDHGPGIPADFQPRLFQRFSQSTSSNTRTTGSTGLGLYITRQLVEGMGGSIGCDSAPGEGARFYVLLPVTEMMAHTPTSA